MPLIVIHGWPGSVIEQLNIIDPLTNPTANGASASDAFHLVIPSMPGYGASFTAVARTRFCGSRRRINGP
jgi:pimeloyl-ACP methyl ester carboxylesterase